MSPTVFREGGLRFFFLSREEMRVHIHVEGQNGEAKFWLEPEIEVARNQGLSDHVLRRAARLIEAHKSEVLAAWENHFGR